MTRDQLLRKEEKSYREYLDALHSRNPPGTLSHFEHNLEVSHMTIEFCIAGVLHPFVVLAGIECNSLD